jgi:ankyrin repeat protein
MESLLSTLHAALPDVKLIERFLEHGANASLNALDSSSPLHWLVLLSEIDVSTVAKALVTRGAALNPSGSAEVKFDDLCLELYGSPLSWAIQCQNLKVVDTLLDLGASPIEDHDGNTYKARLWQVFVSVRSLAAEIAERLLSHDDFYLKLMPDDKEDIFTYIGVGSPDFQRWLINGSSHEAGYSKVTDTLARYDIHLPLVPRAVSKRQDCFTPLTRAAISYSVPLMKELFRLGANVNDRDRFGHTALDFAIRNSGFIGSPKTVYRAVELLLQHGADTRSVLPSSGNLVFAIPPALHKACKSWPLPSIIRLLAIHNPEVVNTMANKSTPLQSICSPIDENTLANVQALVESGAELDIEGIHEDRMMGCCLTASAQSMADLNWPVVKYLLDQGASTEFGTMGNHRHSILHLIIFHGFLAESRGRPGQIASLISATEKLLSHEMARRNDILNSVNFRGVSPLRMAIYYGLPRLVKLLVSGKYGSCKDILEERGATEEFLAHTFQCVPPFVVDDDVKVNDTDNMEYNLDGDLVPYINISVYRARVGEIKELLNAG